MNKSEKERGITLIVLVIMIVMLLILVMVPLKILIDKDVFNHARKVNNKTEDLIKEQHDVSEDVRDYYR